MDVTLLSFLADIPLFVVVLVVLILVHELGHFLVAKWSGMRVDEFGIGFPPRVWGKQYGETVYTLNALPFGGFVKIHGEDPNEESMEGADSARSFTNQSKWKQAATLFAGVAMNVVLGWVLFSAAFMVGMPNMLPISTSDEVTEQRLLVAGVLEDSPAQEAGLEQGSEILQLSAGEDVLSTDLTPDTVNTFIESHASEPIDITYSLQGSSEEITSSVQARTGVIESEPDDPAVGIAMQTLVIQQFNPIVSLWEGAEYTVKLLGFIGVALGSLLADAVSFSADVSEVAGPVGLVALVGGVSELGFVFLLVFVGAISLNLAIINLVPFPALDGGRLLFLAIEAVKGSPIRPQVANAANLIGFALLILLMILVTYSDIVRLVQG